ncbi:hypothetical protein D1AOALGA4SA_7176 [Olavius algarvensis Delta 1 endosymbiont]|nr:hypothetical protein D1AOALGA4SA_7176 [Olavius algarvensis Delta 1 endosymbiont]
MIDIIQIRNSIFLNLFCRRKPCPLGQIRDNRLCRESCCKRKRNDGILECWNAGFSGMGSIFITMARISL